MCYTLEEKGREFRVSPKKSTVIASKQGISVLGCGQWNEKQGTDMMAIGKAKSTNIRI